MITKNPALSLCCLFVLLLTFAMPASGGELSHWKLDALPEGKVVSSSGDHSMEAVGPVLVEDSRRGKVLRFEQGDGLEVPQEILARAGDTLAVSMWLKPGRSNRDPQTQHILRLNPANSRKNQAGVYLRWNRFWVRDGDRLVDLKKALEAHWWNHVLVVRDPRGVEIFVNGESWGLVPVDSTPPGLQDGVRLGSGDFHGEMADLRLFDHRPDASELQAIMQKDTPPPDLAGGDQPAPNIPGKTVERVAKDSRFTVQEIRENFPPISGWAALGVQPDPAKAAEGFAAERFKKPPAPYVHPRIYFNPEDLPEIRARLKSDPFARVQMELARGRLLQFSSDEQDWTGLPSREEDLRARAPDDLAQGRRVVRRMGYHGPWMGGWLDDLAAGRPPAELEGTWEKILPDNPRRYLMNLLPYEAFRCLVDEDEQGGKRVAAALVTICRELSKHMETFTSTDDWQAVYWALSSDAIGVTYDWIYPFMNEAQRDEVRAFIASVVKDKTFIGLEHLPAFPANTTNWIGIHMNLMTMALAIEGETGCDDAVYRRCVEGLRKWVYIANGPCGAPFEGYNKSTYTPQWLIPLAKRGEPLLGTGWSKNVIRNYFLHTMLPDGSGHVFETGIGAARDTTTFKFAYPDDPVVDIIDARSKLNNDALKSWPGIRSTYAPWWPSLAIAQSPIGTGPDGSHDFDKAFDRVMADLQKNGEPTGFYSDYRGLMTARTAWDRQATFLLFEPRNIPGGHTAGSRNDFVIASHGRLWGNRPESVEPVSETRSVMLIDGIGQGHHCPQGKTVAFVDTPEATFGVGDATWAYSHKAGKDDDTLVAVTPNDSRVHPSPLPWMKQPWSNLPAWNTGMKGGGRHGHWATHNPVEKAFRTIGLVKGGHPYILCLDDYRKGGGSHRYDWQMQVAGDVELLERKQSGGSLDLMLGDGEGRRLLVRVLASGDAAEVAPDTVSGAKLEEYQPNPKKPGPLQKRLVLPAQSEEGQFKILFYPHREGDALPETSLADGRLRVALPGQTDNFQLTKRPDGRTGMAMSRKGKAVLSL